MLKVNRGCQRRLWNMLVCLFGIIISSFVGCWSEKFAFYTLLEICYLQLLTYCITVRQLYLSTFFSNNFWWHFCLFQSLIVMLSKLSINCSRFLKRSNLNIHFTHNRTWPPAKAEEQFGCQIGFQCIHYQANSSERPLNKFGPLLFRPKSYPVSLVA